MVYFLKPRNLLISTYFIGKRLRYLSSTSIQDATKAIFRKAQAVCFDVDSTVVTDEGIDVLAAYLGKGEAVAELTRK